MSCPIKDRVLFVLLLVDGSNAIRRKKREGVKGRVSMLGWTILFALMSFSGVVPILAGHPSPLFLKTASVLFAALFLISVLTRAVRDQSR